MAVDYTGVDSIRWDDIPVPFQGTLNRMVYDDILNLESLDRQDYNIIVFPKSIGELGPQVIESLRQCFAATHFQKNRIAVICSMRIGNWQSDFSKFRNLAAVFEHNHDYQLDDGAFSALSNDGVVQLECELREIYPQFCYPPQIQQDLVELYLRCPHIRACTSQLNDDCRQNISRYPNSRNARIVYAVVPFERVA